MFFQIFKLAVRYKFMYNLKPNKSEKIIQYYCSIYIYHYGL